LTNDQINFLISYQNQQKLCLIREIDGIKFHANFISIDVFKETGDFLNKDFPTKHLFHEIPEDPVLK